MRHSVPYAPQFYVTSPQPCPYLEGRIERKLFTALQGDNAEALNDTLSAQGFRRSQNVLYRPSCTECNACLSARVRVADFKPSKSQRRVTRRNSYLQRKANSAWATEEQFDLFQTYLAGRHADGGMADMDVFEFAAMIEETPVRTRVVEYRSPSPVGDHRDPLTAVCLTDVLQDGVSMVYSFFDPNQARASLGTYMVLDHIEIARAAGLPYVYLGYWVAGSPKMDYKSKFSALEVFWRGSWRPMEEACAAGPDMHPLASDPIPQQVNAIALPQIE